MKVLIDTNVILTYILNREDLFTKESEEIMTLCASGEIDGFIAFHSLSIIWYVLRRCSDTLRRQWLKDICAVLAIADSDHSAVLTGIENVNFKDFEDCLQDCCAKNVKADYIITENTKDYDKVSIVKAIDPKAFLLLYHSPDTPF